MEQKSQSARGFNGQARQAGRRECNRAAGRRRQARGAGRLGSVRRVYGCAGCCAADQDSKRSAAGSLTGCRCCASPAPPAVAPPIKTVSAPQQASEPPAAAPAAPAPITVSAQPTSPAALNNEGQEKRAAKKAKRKPKPEPRGPAKHDMEDGGTTVASGNANDRAPADRAARRPDRSPRIVERWIERDYDVPSARGDGRRRVTVSRRGGGGIFENLFGGGGATTTINRGPPRPRGRFRSPAPAGRA